MDKALSVEKRKPKISVIMPVYNGDLYLKESIESILQQSFSDFEFIIINDGSTDKSEEIIKNFKDSRILYTKNEANIGLIASLNKALTLSKGEYIARMDQDDFSLPQRFQNEVDFLDSNSAIAIVSSKLILTDETGVECGYWDDDFETTTETEIEKTIPKINCIGHPTVMMRRSAVAKYGYNKAFKNSEDWGLWLTVLSNGGRIAKIDEVLLKYRIHKGGTTVVANRESVYKKIIRFKKRYLLHKLFNINFRKWDLKVLKSLVADSLKYYLPFFYNFLVKFGASHFFSMYIQWKKFRKAFNNKNFTHQSIFFFPFYHLGGAELVHSEVVEAVAFTRPLVLFTSGSSSAALLPTFQKNATVLQMNELLIWPFTKKYVEKKILLVLKNNINIKLFACNSQFYYEFIKSIPPEIRAMDLIHAFMHKHEESAEKWSLPVVGKLAARVIINKKTALDLKSQYEENKVDSNLLQRIIYISNFVDRQEKPDKNFNDVLKILYVGRGTAEKRVPLLATIARELQLLKMEIEFHFVGDLKSVIPPDCEEYCILHGEIIDKERLGNLYAQSHILAMASTREGFPMVIMEAMMQGCIPITSNVGGISQHVINHQNGILILDTEPALFKKSFILEIQMLLASREKLKFMSENAYEYALENFGPSQFNASYKKLFAHGL